jgi:outer membrane immunogenic protein
MKSVFYAGCVLAVLSSPTLAADATVAEPAYEWTGFYAGVQLGYGWGRLRTDEVPIQYGGIDRSDSWAANGALGGIHAGYNQAYGQLVLGTVADVEASGVSGSLNQPYAGLMDTRIDVQGSLRARLGYALGPALFYTTGGVAVASVSTTYDAVANGSGTKTDSSSHALVGWTLGAGLEYAIARNWTTRVEYRYTDFGSFTDRPVTDPSYQYPTSVKTQAVRIGVSYRF